jgi:hypothetical protein
MNVEILASIVESITGFDPLRAGRSRPVVYARVLLVHALREQGYTQQRIGELIGFTRIAVQHYCTMFAEAKTYNNNPELLRDWERLGAVLKP